MYLVESAITGQLLKIFDRKGDADKFARAWERNTGEECYVVFDTWWA